MFVLQGHQRQHDMDTSSKQLQDSRTNASNGIQIEYEFFQKCHLPHDQWMKSQKLFLSQANKVVLHFVPFQNIRTSQFFGPNWTSYRQCGEWPCLAMGDDTETFFDIYIYPRSPKTKLCPLVVGNHPENHSLFGDGHPGYMVAPPPKHMLQIRIVLFTTDLYTGFGLWSLLTCLKAYMGIGFPERLLVVRSCLLDGTASKCILAEWWNESCPYFELWTLLL